LGVPFPHRPVGWRVAGCYALLELGSIWQGTGGTGEGPGLRKVDGEYSQHCRIIGPQHHRRHRPLKIIIVVERARRSRRRVFFIFCTVGVDIPPRRFFGPRCTLPHSCTAAMASLLKHLVVTGKHRWRYCRAKRLCGSQIDRKLKSGQQRSEGFANETELSQFSGPSKMRRLRLGELLCYLIGAIILSYWWN